MGRLKLLDLLLYIVLILVAVALFIVFYADRKRQLTYLQRKLDENREAFLNAIISFRSILNSNYYISKAKYWEWHDRWNYLKPVVEEIVRKNLRTEFDEKLKELMSFFESGESLIKMKNEKFVQDELQKYRDFFDSIEVHPLTENQRRAIVTEEKHNLVIAGAGTGKTSTLIGKAGYLLKKGFAEPHEVLLISFSRKVKDELEERALWRLGQKLRIETFHSLGLSIIADVEKKKPSVSKLSIDPIKLQNKIMEFIQKKQRNKEFLRKLNWYFAFNKTPYKSEFSFKSKGEYINFLRDNQVRTLNGELVKSLEECDIANFLYINGIKYVYEGDYKVGVATKKHRQYKPDFYLPTYDVYIEHFGVDRKGRTAPFVDREKYLAEMSWKRRIHRENNTVLIETYSWEKTEGVLLENLKRKLLSAGVKLAEIPPEQVFNRLNKLGLVHPFTRLLATFLNLFKSTQNSIQELYELAKEMPDYNRCKAFIDIFSEIYKDYEESLGKEIDFNDMINKAERYISKGVYHSKFKYILVDEFQDISYNRFKLMKALLASNPSAKLFCVGDDWQSIYRFTGSDVSIMTNFNDYFKPSEILYLNKTFRFNDKLCEFSSKFILKNPNQIEKQLTSHIKSNNPAVTLLWSETTENTVQEVLDQINLSEKNDTEVFIIGRYNRQRPTNLKQLQKRFSKLNIQYITAHSSKGKEADYVIVIGLTSYGYAFPSQIEDDPVLNMVLAKKESVPNAEERRLFYVALTRAKKHVYLVASREYPSTFASEIISGDYEVIVKGRREEANILCPVCKTGVIVRRHDRSGNFYSCSNYPYCEYKPWVCPSCNEGFLYENPGLGESATYFVCSNRYCSFKSPKCPNCKDGYLVLRKGRYSQFLGCSNYPFCKYTRSIRNNRIFQDTRA